MVARTVVSVSLFFAATPAAGVGTQLPTALVCGKSADRSTTGSCGIAAHDSSWWAKVYDKLILPPHESMLELSKDISHYYYALGHQDALTDELKAHRVGGEGMYHIFHLPKGPDSLKLPSGGDRRASFSGLVQLEQGQELGDYPSLATAESYENPLGPKAQELEAKNMEMITPDLWMGYLKGLVATTGEDGVQTRSWSNAPATKTAADFLQKSFLEMGLSSCTQTFEFQNSKLPNVVAMIPGTDTEHAVVLVAHYDSRPFSGLAPGAEDNGSGVAALLTNAKVAAASGIKPKRNIIFVAVGAEEPGIKGSAHLVPSLQRGYAFLEQLTKGDAQLAGECAGFEPSFLERRKRTGHNMGIVFDEIAWVPPSGEWKVNLETRDTDDNMAIMQHMSQANAMYNGDKLGVVHNAKPFGSDHMSFLDNQEHGTAILNDKDGDYPNYHSSGDQITPENINPEFAAAITRMSHGGMLRLAGIEESAPVVAPSFEQVPNMMPMRSKVRRQMHKRILPGLERFADAFPKAAVDMNYAAAMA